jgi:hypothetical protein
VKPECVVAFDDRDVAIESEIAFQDRSREAMVSQAETHGLTDCGEGGEREGVNTEILEPMPLTGAESDAGIPRQSMDVFKKQNPVPIGDLRPRVVKRLCCQANRNE